MHVTKGSGRNQSGLGPYEKDSCIGGQETKNKTSGELSHLTAKAV